MYKNILILFMVLVATNLLHAQSWIQKQDIAGGSGDYRGAFSFEINGKIYVGGGEKSRNIFVYDTLNNSWTSAGLIPGCVNTRYGAVGFALHNKGYVAFGEDIDTVNGIYSLLADMWEFDPLDSSWVQLQVPQNMYRFGSSVFVVGDFAYIVGGFDSATIPLNETWQFDGVNWLLKSPMPIANHSHGSTFVLNGRGYIACGFFSISFGGNYINTLFEYDATLDTWSQKADFPGGARSEAFGFSLGVHGYCGLGSFLDSNLQFNYFNDFYAYDPSTDSWGVAIINFPGFSRQNGVSVSGNSGAYIGAGWNYYFSTNINVYYHDWYKFEETSTGIESNSKGLPIKLYPNPCKDILYIENGKLKEASIFNSLGSLMGCVIINERGYINMNKFREGIYYVLIDGYIRIKVVKIGD